MQGTGKTSHPKLEFRESQGEKMVLTSDFPLKATRCLPKGSRRKTLKERRGSEKEHD